ncbi:PLDc_N domain-containing protein [Actinotalea ferrariae]|uniref:PLD nuclease N-terminal domain-containing protein n=1 Tax=Actinotalea ferrariae TaxID=1386098 RepID=UPI001C8BEF82|nr:PLD nuclease N-terminal domain-containing protein [Actinotalea ferrariae]MBX9246237.1 PLDc_N domain-containing protein [Actinotalea ferrariae]
MVRALPYIVPIALALFGLIDLSRSNAVERAGIHPLAWVAIIVLLPVVGPIAWIAVSRQRAAAARQAASGGGRGTARPAPGRPQTRRTGPLAPDDDPDFLWKLEQERRRQARGTGGAGGTTGGDAPDDTVPEDGNGRPS